jgi:hypothetical protein
MAQNTTVFNHHSPTFLSSCCCVAIFLLSGLHASTACEKRHSFLNFSYVCPEPVLVKSSFLYK